MQTKDLDGRAVGQFLDCNDVARSKERPSEECERHLTATSDADVISARGNAARRREHRRDGGAQALVSLWSAVSKECAAAAAQGATIGTSDQVGRHEPNVWPIGGEEQSARRNVVRHLRPGRGWQLDQQTLGHRLSIAELRIEATRGRRGQRGRHKGPARGAGDHPALRNELVEGRNDGETLNAQGPRQRNQCRAAGRRDEAGRVGPRS